MSIKCLLGYHDWKFAYNHGIPLGTNMNAGEILLMLRSGEAFSVDQCSRCTKQSRMIDNERVLLSRGEAEAP